MTVKADMQRREYSISNRIRFYSWQEGHTYSTVCIGILIYSIYFLLINNSKSCFSSAWREICGCRWWQ